ncbi:hypothetical protein LTR70_000271 [Exophiala xenobiotica]|nr:hypothetical protein LTR70_000271 [Exophiala xenobiotica]
MNCQMRDLTLAASIAMVWLAVSAHALVGLTSSIPEASSAALPQTEAARKSVLVYKTALAEGIDAVSNTQDADSSFAAFTSACHTAPSSVTLSFATPLAVLESEYGCGYGYVPCGPVCCEAGQQCVQDIVGNLACCPVGASCYGSLTQTVASKTLVYTTNTPINAAGRIVPLAIFGHIMGIVRKVQASISGPTSTGLALSRSSSATLACESGFVPCGNVCCLPSQHCTEDIHANFAYCDDLESCAGSTSWLPANSAHRLALLSVVGQAVALVNKACFNSRLSTTITTSQAHSTTFQGKTDVGLLAAKDHKKSQADLETMDDGASLTSEAGRPRASLLSKLIAKLKWTAAQMSRKSAPSMDAQFHIDQLEHISHNSLQCPKLRCIVTTAGSYCIRNGANTSEVVRPAFKPALRKRGEEHTNGDHMDVYGIVPRQGYGKSNNYALVCLGTKEATQACQAKDFEYYCDTDGEVKNKGKYNDEQCAKASRLRRIAHVSRLDYLGMPIQVAFLKTNPHRKVY